MGRDVQNRAASVSHQTKGVSWSGGRERIVPAALESAGKSYGDEVYPHGFYWNISPRAREAGADRHAGICDLVKTKKKQPHTQYPEGKD